MFDCTYSLNICCKVLRCIDPKIQMHHAERIKLFEMRIYLHVLYLLFHCWRSIACKTFERVQNWPVTCTSTEITCERIFNFFHADFSIQKKAAKSISYREIVILHYYRRIFEERLSLTCTYSLPNRGNKNHIEIHSCLPKRFARYDIRFFCFLFLRSSLLSNCKYFFNDN